VSTVVILADDTIWQGASGIVIIFILAAVIFHFLRRQG
jgi:hypothetical protein